MPPLINLLTYDGLTRLDNVKYATTQSSAPDIVTDYTYRNYGSSTERTTSFVGHIDYTYAADGLDTNDRFYTYGPAGNILTESRGTESNQISAGKEKISATPEHPFYVRDRGWTGAVDLKAGDVLVLQDGGYVVVEKIQHEILEKPVTVYNFEVEDFHTYYVGKNSILVHNTCMKSQAKRIDPAQFEKEYDLAKGDFHKKIKNIIKSKVTPIYQEVGHNPDILMDRKGNIAYQGAKGRGYQDTYLNIVDIFKEMK